MMVGLILLLVAVSVAIIAFQFYRSSKFLSEANKAMEVLELYERGESFSDNQIKNMETVIEKRVEEYKLHHQEAFQNGTIPLPDAVASEIRQRQLTFDAETLRLNRENQRLADELEKSRLQIAALAQELESANSQKEAIAPVIEVEGTEAAVTPEETTQPEETEVAVAVTMGGINSLGGSTAGAEVVETVSEPERTEITIVESLDTTDSDQSHYEDLKRRQDAGEKIGIFDYNFMKKWEADH